MGSKYTIRLNITYYFCDKILYNNHRVIRLYLMNKIVLCIISIFFFTSCSKNLTYQQSNRDKNASTLNPEEARPMPSPQARASKQKKFLFFFKRKQKTNWGDQLVVEYHERMKENAKAAKKKAKEMEKPQYSDPSYFGHKRKPKKRPPHKMKFCEECGIRH